ncbi:efflux RND transporter permease subunit, partial [candidate division KSB1 bacterium]|nr:efflux RND transporter permease subunit [candidate division KSB1 bacterium]
GTNEVAMAITASTLTTLAVFLPVLFVPGLAGQLFKEMVITICFSLAVSLIVALTLIPLLSSRFLKIASADAPKTSLRKFAARMMNIIERWKDFYGNRLNWSLHHRTTVILTTLGLLIISILLLTTLGGEFLPEGDDNFMTIAVDRSPGVSLEQMEKTMRAINGILEEEVPEGEFTYANFGQGEGIMAFFSSRSAAEGDISIELKSRKERDRDEDAIKASLRDKFSQFPDATITFSDRGQAAMMGGGDIVVMIIGHDLNVAQAIANDVQKKIDKIEGIVYTESSLKEARPELRINLDRNRIADLGLSTAQVGQTVSTSVLGNVVTRYREGGDEYDVRVQLAKDARKSKEDIENILVMTPTGRQIPLRAIATIDYDKSPQEITREDQERFVSINIDIEKSSQLRAITAQVREVLKETPVPTDYRYEISGTAEDMQESFIYLIVAFMVAILLVYMVMASQFESLVDPFIILFTVPLALIGVAFSLFITGTSLSVMALVGLVMLVGIVVNNGIVLIDYINQLRDRGYGLFDAIIEAGRIRMRPVLMTASTTILAMLPLALGLGESGESWAPMARSVMGGLIVGTILTLIIVPVIYASLELGAEKRKARRVARKRARMQRKAAPHMG